MNDKPDSKRAKSDRVLVSRPGLKPPKSHLLRPSLQRPSRSAENSPISSPDLSRRIFTPIKAHAQPLEGDEPEDILNLTSISITPEDEDQSAEDKNNPLLRCPCGNSDPTSTYIKCAQCQQEWHSRCCNLSGITPTAVKKLTTWECPSCYICSHTSSGTDNKIGLEVGKFSASSARIEKCTEQINDSATAIEFFNEHIRHLLLNEKKFSDETTRTKEIIKSLDKIKKQMEDQENVLLSFHELKESMDKNNTILTEKVGNLQYEITSLLQTPSSLSDVECGCKDLMKAIHDQLQELSNDTPPETFPKLLPESDHTGQYIEKISCMEKEIISLSGKISSMEDKLDKNLEHTSNVANTHLENTPRPNLEHSPNVANTFRRSPLPNTSSPHLGSARDTPCDPFQHYLPNVISPETKTQLLKLTTDMKDEFQTIGETNQTRDVLYFGEYRYKYTGMDHDAKPMPAEILQLVEEIRCKLPEDNKETPINSCLISRYNSGSNVIPHHQDDEPTINPDSLIMTASLGASRMMSFVCNDQSKNTEVLLEDCSLLVSSRFAQDYWKHGIGEDESGEIRYSFTFRHIAPHFLNSTIVIGDSNTRFLKFGEGQGTLGKWLPGKRMKAGHIEEIPVPEEIGPYRNIVLHTGINNFNNPSYRKSDTYLIHTLEQKCKDISSIYPKTRIHISLLLPTRSRALNQKVRSFNDQLLDMTFKNKNLYIIDNSLFGDCLSNEFGRWDTQGGKPNTRDILHLGKKGIRLLATNIKQSVVKRPQSQSRARFNGGRGEFGNALGRTASNVVSPTQNGYQP